MKLSIFLTITAVISTLFGGMMLIFPGGVMEGFGTSDTPFSAFLMREMGLLILCAGILNFLMRSNDDPNALKAILIFNMVYHIIMIPMVLMAVSQSVFSLDKSLGGLAAHLFIGIGSIYYLTKIRTPGD